MLESQLKHLPSPREGISSTLTGSLVQMPAHARTFNREKALEAILYVARHLESASLHSISKILYLADKRHLERFGRLISGDRYIAMEFGPVPSAIYDMMKVADNRDSIDADWDAIIKESFAIQGGRYVKPLRKTNMDMLARSEVECFDHTIKKYGRKTFGQLTDLTHDAAWKGVGENQPISLEAIARTLPNSGDLVAYIRGH